MAWRGELTISGSSPALAHATVDSRSEQRDRSSRQQDLHCRGGIPPLTREEAELFQPQTPDWRLAEEPHRIERSFRFRDFREALTFVQEIGELAEAEGHHPNISFG